MGGVDGISGVDLSKRTYKVEQSLVRNHYQVYDGNGELLLRADRAFRPHRTVPFVNTDGNEVFSVEANTVDDDFRIVPAGSERPLAILERDTALLRPAWNVRHGSSERLLASIESREPVVEFFRYYVPLMGVLPHTYVIEDADGREIGTLSGQLTLSETYELDIETTEHIDQKRVVAAALSVDALDIN